MSARPNTTQADQAAGEQPMLERPMGRRTLLRAAIVTVPMVAAFARNAHAATDGHGCQLPSYSWCPACNKCLLVNDISSSVKCTCRATGNGGCTNAACQQATPGHPNVVGQNSSSSLTSPFNSGSTSITDGGFNSSPWQ